MSDAATVTRNAAWLMAQRVLMGIFAIFVVAVVARYLGTERYGELVLLLSYNALVAQLASLGLRPLSVRLVAADRPGAQGIVEEMVALRGVLAVAAAALAVAYLHWIDPFLPDSLILVFAAVVVTNAYAMCFIDGLYGVERIREVATSLATSGAIVQVASLAAVALDAGLVGVAGAYVLGNLASLVIAWRFLRSGIGPLRLRAPHAGLLRHLRDSRTYFLQNFVHTVRQRLDVVLITTLVGTHAAGVYGASLTLVQRLDIVQDALTTALFPRISSFKGEATDELRELSRLSLKLMLVVSLPFALGIYGISEDIVALVFGAKFSDAAPVLALLALSIPFSFVYGLLYNVLGAMGRQDAVFRLALMALVPGLLATVVGIRLGGVPGAAAALVAVVAMLALQLVVHYQRTVGGLWRATDLLRIAAANAVMGACLWASTGQHVAVRVVACAAVYALVVVAVRVVSLSMVRSLLASRRGRQAVPREDELG